MSVHLFYEIIIDLIPKNNLYFFNLEKFKTI